MTALRIKNLAARLIERASARDVMIATAESCTGGMIGAALTDIAGASAVFERGFITYSNEAKAEMLDVPMALLDAHGAVSAEVAMAMAAGALRRSRANLAVSVTGVAGPDGGSDDKPVGLVWFGLAGADMKPRAEKHVFTGGDRHFVRTKTVETALEMLLSQLHD